MRSAGMKVLIGLMPLLNWRNAQFLSHEVPGIRIPETILGRFYPEQDKEEALETGLAVILDLARRFRTQSDGFYLIPPFNRSTYDQPLPGSPERGKYRRTKRRLP
jgi:homocysteine S-methyltransferase